MADIRTIAARGRGPAARTKEEAQQDLGLRERKKARLRQQIIDTAIGLFRKHGYENTRVDDIVQTLEISQPTFFRYFPSKDAVLRDVALRSIACITEQLTAGLAGDASTAERLHKSYMTMARHVEADRALWQAVVLSGVMDPVRSPEIRQHDEATVNLLREVLSQGQKRGDITRAISVVILAEFMGALYRTAVRHWAVDITGPHRLTDRVRMAVDFFMRAAKP